MESDRFEILRARLEVVTRQANGNDTQSVLRRRLVNEIAMPLLDLWGDVEQEDDFDPFDATALILMTVVNLVKELLLPEYEHATPEAVHCVIKRHLDRHFPHEAARAGPFHISSELH